MSSKETASGERPSTALATKWLMAVMFCGARWAPGLILTSTLALEGCWASRNTESLGKVRGPRRGGDPAPGRSAQVATQVGVVHGLGRRSRPAGRPAEGNLYQSLGDQPRRSAPQVGRVAFQAAMPHSWGHSSSASLS